MLLQLKNPKMSPSKPPKNETRQATVDDADKTEGKDRDLGEGGTLGLGRPEDLGHDDQACFANRDGRRTTKRAAASPEHAEGMLGNRFWTS
jgi:hypothetical protein